MHQPYSGWLLLIPVLLAVGFMLWFLWRLWNDERR